MPNPSPSTQAPHCSHQHFTLPATNQSVSEARSTVRRHLRYWHVDSDLADQITLVVSELFTNAVIHSNSSTIECVLNATGNRIRLEVANEGTECASLNDAAPADASAEHGRGLMLVTASSNAWGLRNSSHRHSCAVWASWDRPQPHST